MKDERTHHGAMVNLNRNNKFVLANRYSVLGVKTGHILLLLVGLMAGREGGRPADKMWGVLKFLKFSMG